MYILENDVDDGNSLASGSSTDERDDPISAHLFSVDFARWKVLRAKLTPTFTSGRMKFMFQTIVDVADNFQKCLGGMVEGNENFEMKDVLSRFTTDVIGEYFY